jgi:hypothetical protein
MKKQINPKIKAHLIRSACYVLLLVAVFVIPFALAQSRSRGTTKHSVARPSVAHGTTVASGAVKAGPPSSSAAAGTMLQGRQTAPRVATAPTSQAEMRSDVEPVRSLSQSQSADSAINHVAPLGPKEKPARPLLKPRQAPGGFDCNNAPGIIIHDDGTLEDGFSGNPLAGVNEVRFVDKFTPTQYPNSYNEVCVDFVTLAGGPSTYNIDIVVYDDDGPGGSPGTLLGQLNAQTANTHIFAGGITPIWNSYNISSMGLNITSGSVYIGVRYVPPSPVNVYTSADESPGHPVGFAGGQWWNNNDNAWAPIQNAFPNYRSLMVRATQASGGVGTPTPTPTCSATPIVSENFDGVTPPALPPGWTAVNVIDPDGILWQSSNSGDPQPPADSLPNAVWINDAGSLADKRLTSLTFTYGAGDQLSFRQNFDIEQQDGTTSYDNGLLEISFDNGSTFQEFVAAGGSFVTGGYNHTAISTGFQNPCMQQYGPNQPNWSGVTGGFQTTTANLPAAGVGQQVKLRWRECSDASVSHTGWRVDNFAIGQACAPTPTPTPGGGCTINGSLDGSDPTQIDRLFRGGIPQTCPASNSCAIFGDPTPRHYDAYTFTNNTGAPQCVTIDPTTQCVGTNYVFVAAYADSFDPNNICNNWIGDSGLSPDPSQPPVTFQVNVSDGQTFVIVVSEVTPGAGCPAYTVTVSPQSICGGGTPTPTPTCVPGSPNGGAGPWTAGNPYPTTIVRYGFAQTATHFYVFGGVDNGSTTNAVNRMNLATGTWEPRAPMPFGGEAPTCALDTSTNIVYCADGLATNSFAAYDIAANSWTSLAPDPFVSDHYGSASGAFNGKVYVVGGTGSYSNAVWIYDVATNSWSVGNPAPTGPFELAGYQEVGQFLYLVGGYDPSFVNINTTLRLDMSTGTWQTGPTFTPQLADFGLAYDAGTNKLYSLGGDLPNDGNPFNSTNQVNELDLSAWPGGTWNPSPPNLPSPPRQAAQSGFYGNGDIWSVGGINGATFQFLNEVWFRANGGCVTPTPTATATVTITPTPTATATVTITPTPTATATVSVTVTPTVTPTATPTATQTPRVNPTPRSRPTPFPRPR